MASGTTFAFTNSSPPFPNLEKARWVEGEGSQVARFGCGRQRQTKECSGVIQNTPGSIGYLNQLS